MKQADKPTVNPQKKGPPARTPEARENQLIALAMDVVEERMRNGTASSQEVTHFLKLGSVRERKELILLEQELELKKAKTESIQSVKRIEELYKEAMKAFSIYSGVGRGDEDDQNL